MSQDSREKFGVKSQISIGGAVGGGESREKRYVESRTKLVLLRCCFTSTVNI